jgi:signal transduction histidine kinase
MIISQKAKDILISSYENYALLLGQNLSHQVFQNYMLPTVTRYGYTRLSDKDQYELVDKIVKNTTYSFRIDLVNLYAIKQGVIAYSTNPKLIGEKADKTYGYQKAVSGEHYSRVISKGKDILGFEIRGFGKDVKIRTYTPFLALDIYTGRTVISGVFELIQDMSEQYESIVKFQYLIFGLSTLIMVLIFLSLLLIVQKAEKIIEERAKEQRELERQLHLAERLAALGEMVAGVSHEIKNPLGIIQSTSELLTTLSDTSEEQKQLSGVIKEESARLNSIVTEFLDFAKPQELNIRECHLEEIIKKNLSFLSPELDKKGIIINDNLDGKKFKIHADQDVLYRALLNLFINAIHSIEGTGNININIEREKGNYLIEIQDTGKGISQENLQKIFNPFFTTKDTGTGLGLPIVKKIIESHKGTIEIESIEYFGTKVTIRLPRLP